MANPTTNFGWQMPTASDLVTDLPADFEVFGQAVDTALAELKGGTTGQVLSKTSNTDMDFTWVTSDDANAIQNTQLTAKGALITAFSSATPATLTVGNNGETLVADSSTSTGLRYQSNFSAGKNAIINGAFNNWQRGTSFSVSNSSAYTADRFFADNVGTCTVSQQAFTAGTAPVAGYESQYFLRFNQTGAGAGFLIQKIEDVRQFAGQTITVSVWAKAAATLSLAGQVRQNFGSGGSASVNTTLTTQTVTTSWARYSWTIAVPSVSGQTIGTSSFLQIRLDLPSTGTYTFDTWGWQVEAGNTATAFQTATGTIQGELAACQRYYWRTTAQSSSTDNILPLGVGATSTEVQVTGNFPVRMRIAPSAVEWAGLRTYDTNAFVTVTALTLGTITSDCYLLNVTGASGMVQYRPTQTRSTSSNPANSYVGFTAEL